MIRFGRRKLSRVPARSSRASKSSTAEPALNAAPDEGFAIDEERFFNEPETFSTELTTSEQEEPRFSSTLAPTAMGTSEVEGAPSEHDARVSEPDSAVRQTHRTRLRRVVAAILCTSAAILLLGVTLRSADGIRAKGSAPIAHLAATPAQAVLSSRPPPETPVPVLAPEPLASASHPTGAFDPATAKSAGALVRSARALLQAGQIRAGVSVARQALAANGSDAEPYLLLAAGLQDLGEWSAAQTVFAACKQKARHGSSAACRYFSSRAP